MTGQKQRIIKRFEREAKRASSDLVKAGGLVDWKTITFTFDEIENIILLNDNDENLEHVIKTIIEVQNDPVRLKEVEEWLNSLKVVKK